MKLSALFSRRDTDAKVDFRPDMDEKSPDGQARRLSVYLGADGRGVVLSAGDIDDCTDALAALREYSYRKIFTGTTHDEFLALDESDPQHIDWAIRIHEIESERFKSSRR